MTEHQWIALGAWGAVIAFVLWCVLTPLAMFVGGWSKLPPAMVVAMVVRIGPFILIGYTVWAFWPK